MMNGPLLSLVELIREELPGVEAVFLFGSVASGDDHHASDLDLAVLSNPAPAPLALWELSTLLADQTGRHVDLVDLRSASTVMKFQIVNKGRLLWQNGHAGDLFTSVAQREYWDWEIIRRPIIKRIQETGSVYGR